MVTLDPNATETLHLREKNHRNAAIAEHEESKDAKRVIIVDPVPIDPGDIQIGAVEIKNATTDDRAIVYTDGSLKVAATKVPSSYLQNSKLVAATTTDTLLTSVAGANLKLRTLIVGGDADGLFTLSINSTKVATFRNRITNPQVIIPLNSLLVNSGEAIDVDVTNLRNQSRNFECTVIYE